MSMSTSMSNHQTPISFTLGAQFYHCKPRTLAKQFHRSIIGILNHTGKFYEIAPEPDVPSVVKMNPYTEITETGSVNGWIDYRHPDLENSPVVQLSPRAFCAQYRDGIHDNSFTLSSHYIGEDDSGFPELASGLEDRWLGFFRWLIPNVNPKLALIDYTWGTVFSEKQLEATELRKLFWVTYFGPEYVAKYGKQFLLATPCWKAESLHDGVLLQITDHFLEFFKNEPTESLKHLGTSFKGMRPNRFKIDSNF